MRLKEILLEVKVNNSKSSYNVNYTTWLIIIRKDVTPVAIEYVVYSSMSAGRLNLMTDAAIHS